MIISKYNKRIIEKNLCKYNEYLKRQNEKIEDIIYSSGSNSGSGNSNKYLDITGEKAMKLCEETIEKKWLKVIDQLISKFANKDKNIKYLLENKYFKGRSIIEIQSDLHVEKSTIYRWKDDILIFTAILAIQEGLIEL